MIYRVFVWMSNIKSPLTIAIDFLIYLGVIGMIVELVGLVIDGSASDAIPPTRGFENLSFLYASWGSVSFDDGEFGWMTFVTGDDTTWADGWVVGDEVFAGSFTKACVVVLFVLEGICVVLVILSYVGNCWLFNRSVIGSFAPLWSWEGFKVCNWCLSCSPTGMTSRNRRVGQLAYSNE